jgi:hypothetical protein
VGMRGKKAPSGFVGMRGKKFNYDYEPSFSDDYQAQLFHELQKEREMLVNLMDEYNNNNYANDMEKRRPEGFVGLRGKKSVSNSDYFIDEKRIPMGFAGVRGKRVPIASFFGMRGKKEPVSQNYSLFVLFFFCFVWLKCAGFGRKFCDMLFISKYFAVMKIKLLLKFYLLFQELRKIF